MIHPPTSREIRTKSAATVIEGLYGPLSKTPYVKTFITFANLPVSPTIVIATFQLVYGPHRLRVVAHQETKNLTGSDVMNFFMSADTLTDLAALDRDMPIIGQRGTGTWLQFVTTLQGLSLNVAIKRALTVYKVAHLNQTPGAAVVNAYIQIEQ